MIIKRENSIIPACDVSSLDKLKKLVEETYSVDGIGAYKIGFSLVIPFGINKVAETIRDITNIPIIYDHQKAGTDIPDTGELFMKSCKWVNAVILFPQSGPVTEESWINAAKNEKINVIIGGEMTHKCYLKSDNGFIDDKAPEKIYKIAKKLGVNDFVVPGNKPEKIAYYRKLLGKNAVFYSPGLIAQGGKLTDSAKAAGKYWHAIIGRALYQAKDINKAAKEFVKYIL